MDTSKSSQRGAWGKAAFAPTLWTMVLQAGRADPDGVKAFDRLIQAYWYPVYAFIRRSGRSHEDAEDLTQAFFVRLQEKQALAGVDPDKGRFRSFLLTALRHFLITDWHRAQAERRGGKFQFVSVEAEEDETRVLEGVPTGNPEQAYDRDVAMTILNRAMSSLAGEYLAAGRARLFETLRPYLTVETDSPAYAMVAAELTMSRRR